MASVPSLPTKAGPLVPFRATTTGDFPQWLSQAGGSIVVSTYQTNLLAVLSWNGQRVNLLFQPFERPMGLAVQDRSLAVVTRDRLWLLANAPPLAPGFAGHAPQPYDALYLPRLAYYTGELHLHDAAWGSDGLWLVNTLFSSLAAPSSDYCFLPRWKPSFITQLLPEDRCHLNGLAMADGQPRFVTAFAASDSNQGWRPDRFRGGVVIDVPSGEVVVRSLCMPHSPRVHDGALWLLNSGAGELLRIDLRTLRPEVVCALPGYTRGLCFVDSYALVGLGSIRDKYKSAGLPVHSRHAQLVCGVAVVNLRTGTLVGMFQFSNGCEELYDVQFLPGVLRPMLLPPDHPAARYALPGSDFAVWTRPLLESAQPATPVPA